ncbi:hypothetical protein MKW94_023301, partial [Papaver nudicaule]|nr:hypothetical protein [Papaver nudicaule]
KLQDNPLLLLGQYSDDEIDDDEHKRLKHDVSESSSIEQKCQEPVSTGCEDAEEHADESDALQTTLEELEKEFLSSEASKDLDGDEVIETGASLSCQSLDEAEPTAQIPDSGNALVQTGGDESSTWKLVMHEESGQYYYWNTVTGETSWEVPDIFVQKAETTTVQKTPGIEDGSTAIANVYTSIVDSGANMIRVAEKYDNGHQLRTWSEGHENEDQEVQYLEPEVRCMEPGGSEAPTAVGDDDKDDHKRIPNEQETALSTRLVEYGKSLLERLKAVE